MTPSEITRAREDLGLTQRALAEHLGVAANTVNRWEAGTAIPPPYLPLVFEAMLCRKGSAMTTPNRFWRHDDECGVPYPHVHYGENVVLHVDDDGNPIIQSGYAKSDGTTTPPASILYEEL